MKYRLRLRARPRGGAPRSPAPPPPPPPPASARPLCATAPPSRVPLAPYYSGEGRGGELTDLLELHLGAGLLEALHGVVADGLGLGLEDGERQTGGHSVLRVLQAEGRERADGLDAGDLLGGVDFSDHDVEVGLLLGSLPPRTPRGPGGGHHHAAGGRGVHPERLLDLGHQLGRLQEGETLEGLHDLVRGSRAGSDRTADGPGSEASRRRGGAARPGAGRNARSHSNPSRSLPPPRAPRPPSNFLSSRGAAAG